MASSPTLAQVVVPAPQSGQWLLAKYLAGALALGMLAATLVVVMLGAATVTSVDVNDAGGALVGLAAAMSALGVQVGGGEMQAAVSASKQACIHAVLGVCGGQNHSFLAGRSGASFLSC